MTSTYRSGASKTRKNRVGGSVDRNEWSQDISLSAQLFAIQGELATDLDGTLKMLAGIGFTAVEAANLPDVARANGLKIALDNHGLACPSAHFHTPQLFADISQAIDTALTLGCDYVIASTPWVADPSRRKNTGNPQRDFLDLMQSLTLDDWKWNAEQFNWSGDCIAKAGLRFGYHNHSFDFKMSNGKIMFEELIRMTDPELVDIELDCGWAASAGFSPAEFINRHAKRIKLLHIKDIVQKPPSTELDMQCAPVGQGCIDWAGVFHAARDTDIEHYIVELEPPFLTPPLPQLDESYAYLCQYLHRG